MLSSSSTSYSVGAVTEALFQLDGSFLSVQDSQTIFAFQCAHLASEHFLAEGVLIFQGNGAGCVTHAYSFGGGTGNTSILLLLHLHFYQLHNLVLATGLQTVSDYKTRLVAVAMAANQLCAGVAADQRGQGIAASYRAVQRRSGINYKTTKIVQSFAFLAN
jgi:hypothetical protein